MSVFAVVMLAPAGWILHHIPEYRQRPHPPPPDKSWTAAPEPQDLKTWTPRPEDLNPNTWRPGDLNPNTWRPEPQGLNTWTPTPEDMKAVTPRPEDPQDLNTKTWRHEPQHLKTPKHDYHSLLSRSETWLRPEPQPGDRHQDLNQDHQQGLNPNYQDKKPEEESSLQDLRSELSTAVATMVHLQASFILHSKLEVFLEGGGFKTV